jgi:hypothetical protein
LELPDPVTEVGTKDAAAPEGRPLTDKLTTSEKPFKALIDAVYGALPPCTVDCEEGEAEMVKSGAGLTVTVRLGGLGSVKPALSVTVNVATKVPAEE